MHTITFTYKRRLQLPCITIRNTVLSSLVEISRSRVGDNESGAKGLLMEHPRKHLWVSEEWGGWGHWFNVWSQVTCSFKLNWRQIRSRNHPHRFDILTPSPIYAPRARKCFFFFKTSMLVHHRLLPLSGGKVERSGSVKVGSASASQCPQHLGKGDLGKPQLYLKPFSTHYSYSVNIWHQLSVGLICGVEGEAKSHGFNFGRMW